MTQTHRKPFLNTYVDALTMEQTVTAALEMVRSGQPHVQVSINAGKVVAILADPALGEAVETADIISADGVPVVWASRLLGGRIPERVNGTDLMERLLREAEARHFSVFFLGSTKAILVELERMLKRRHPGLMIAGMHDGYFAAGDEEQVIDQIKSAKPQLLFVGISSPRKELWLRANRERLGVPYAMGVGGSFDVLAGRVRRAPPWAQRAGLEWLFRLLQEPRRMWRRYLVGNAIFIWLVLRALIRR